MTTTDGFDPVLATAPPPVDGDAAVEIARSRFAVGDAASADDLGSERDRAFRLLDRDGRPLAILKVSNAAESVETLDMEALAVLHIARLDPTLPVALPRAVPGSGDGSERRDDPACYRAAVRLPDGEHQARLYDLLPGRARVDAATLPDAAFPAWGETAARLDLALRGFVHPATHRTMLWDVQHALRTRDFLPAIHDGRHRDLVARVLDRFEAVVAPAWPSLRAQPVHGDLTTDNTLLDDRGRITGIVDFGDMSHSALVTELASVLDSVLDHRPDQLFRLARLVLDGYQRWIPLEPIELRLLPELLAARAAATIAISSWRSAQGLEDAAFAERYNEPVARTIETLLGVGWDDAARGFGADVPVHGEGGLGVLAARRDAVMGPALEPLSYETPIEVAAASGVWITATDGRRYLDAYNNVPCVGHSHPRVTEAIARQARRINTNLRYLHPAAIELGERLLATCPPGIDTVFYVNSGSEANDLAWRLVTTATGRRGGICTEFAYHGISDAIAPLSPETWPDGVRPSHIETWDPGDAGGVAEALRRLTEAGTPAAAAILDAVLTSDGYPSLDPATAQDWLAATHKAGALLIADEVQGGHGRTGAMWSFEGLGIVPDVITLGKPMGNGHPVGAVLTRRELAATFAEATVFFSTFGGNPVSMVASLAVLDVLDDERVLERTATAGEALREALRSASAGQPAIRDVRGVGLAVGVETATRAVAVALREGLRERGVLIGTSGRDGTVLKIRPPLAFTTDEVPVLAEAFRGALEDVAPTERASSG
jgi:4-aminobutyrate aminotransferase-like enzyme/Ser/Thr protein kinase RdoA (MazF antagonist)